jgi:putative ABC transport system permease protein
VRDAGQVSFASVTAIYGAEKKLNVALIGVEPGKPGEPPVVQGRGLRDRAKEALIDRNTTLRTGLKVGDDIVLKTIQGTKEEFYSLRVVGVMDGRQYSLQPAVVTGDLAFDKIRPGAVPVAATDDFVSNIIVAHLDNPGDWKAMAARIAGEVEDTQAVDRKTAYENTPGYSAQQSTLSTQQFFSLLVGILVIGGFFQIQTLQKVPQIGMLKAIGAPTSTIAMAAVAQIILVTLMGVAIGTAATVLMALALPATIPIAFSPSAIVIGIAALMTIGPIGGLVSVRYAVRVEPLSALGLTG